MPRSFVSRPDSKPSLPGQLCILRVYGYRPKGELCTHTGPLRNTPDVQKLNSVSSLRTDLFGWISKNIEAIDQGTYLVEPFLATASLVIFHWASTDGQQAIRCSVDPTVSMPFRAEGFAMAPIEGLGVDRLNNGSCVGCHQASTPPALFLGEDDPEISG